MQSLRSAAGELETAGVRVLGISLDAVADQAKFRTEHELTFSLLSDPDGSAGTKYGVLAEGARWTRRVTFVIDPKGTLRAVEEDVRVDSHGADVMKLVEKLRG